MLPRPRRVGVSYGDKITLLQIPNAIRNYSILAPVAPSDHISCARRRNSYTMFFYFCLAEEGIPPGTDEQLRCRFADRIRVKTAKRVVFTISINPFAVLITFIRSD